MSELYTQILEIERLLNEAQYECQNIAWDNHHPEYPESLHNLMRYIARSKWIYGDYQKHELSSVLKKIENADIEQVKCAITRLIRSEKWCTGSWIKVMTENTLVPLIKRGKVLAKPRESLINKVFTRLGGKKNITRE